MKIYIDEKFFSERDAKVSVFDHGLLYGDGVFEGIRAYNGRVFKLREHIDRLFCSAKAIKLLNYLNNILAKIEANQAGCEEAVMLNAEGFVAECTGDNLFIVRAGELFTPPLSAGALYGITRATVIELARAAGHSVSEPN